MYLSFFPEVNKYFYYLFADKVTFRRTPERRGGNPWDTWEKRVTCRVNFSFESLGVCPCWECLRHSKKVSVGGVE